MFSNYLAAAWRSARRDRFYALLNVFGLGLGFAATVLIALFLRDELSYDRFLPDYGDVYRVQLTETKPGQPPATNLAVPARLAAEMKLDFPEIAATTRMSRQAAGLRHGAVEATEMIDAVDPEFFSVLGFPLLRGDPASALAEPDSIVLTRHLAEKYFGGLDCLGQTLDIDHTHSARVTGIAEDPPIGTTRGFAALLSGKTAYSNLATYDRTPAEAGTLVVQVLDFIRLKPGVAADSLAARFPAFTLAHYAKLDGTGPLFSLHLKALAEMHLYPNSPDTPETNDRAQRVYTVAATGVLILLLAGINFVNLVTARATRRAVEVGVRKALGGMRSQLLMQFMGESVAYALVGMMLGLALAELSLPSVNAVLDRQMSFDLWRQPLLAVPPIVAAMMIGLIAGVYPALILSQFPPATVLKSRAAGPGGSGRLRTVLVVFQFSATIALLIATLVIYRQSVFATSDALGFDKDLILTVDLTAMPRQETEDGLGRTEIASLDALRSQLAAVPGVQGLSASWVVPNPELALSLEFRPEQHADRSGISLALVPVDYGFFGLYRLGLVAGRDFSPDRSDDKTSLEEPAQVSSVILNQTAIRELGLSDAAAVGQDIVSTDPSAPFHFRIIGVAPDLLLGSVRDHVPPTLFMFDPDLFRVMSLKLSGVQLAQTLHGIDAAWHKLVPDHPINRDFVDDRIARLYLDITRDGWLFACFACFSAAIGCLGMIGLSAFTAERRTKEIGIRKALGASAGDIIRLLIWQFVKPVLLANALAWPIAWWSMRRWLDGFAYRIDLDPSPFLVAGLASLAIVIATTAYHALKVARSRPVLALRYE